MNIDLSLDFISCGCSKTPHSLDWGENNWIAFGSSYNVCLIRPEDENSAPQIVGSFCCHQGNVTVVKYVRPNKSTDGYILSGSTDSTTVLWFQNENHLKPLAKLIGHSMAVSYVCGIFVETKKSILIATCSSDSSLKIWIVDPNIKELQTIECFQTVTFGNGFALCADLRFVSSDGLLLAIGNDDNKIRLFYSPELAQHFNQVLILAGHEDWIRDLSFSNFSKEEDKFFLASCSQDNYVRMWKFQATNDSPNALNVLTLKQDEDIKLPGRMFEVINSGTVSYYDVTLDAVLSGHESWVYSVTWNPTGNFQILTSSMDKSIIIWEPDVNVGIWFAKVHLGEIGGPVAGYYGAKFSPDGTSIVGHSFLGGLHSWKLNEKDSWEPKVIPTGHSSSVEDISWDPNGCYLMSCSQDQTTRLFARWRRSGKKVTYHEIARPQVHGHDLQCLSSVSSFCFVSGAEEKIIRAFVAPRTFAKNLASISSLSQKVVEKYLPVDQLAEGASVPALGLSNKAVFAGDMATEMMNAENAETSEKYPVFYFQPIELKQPPTEDYMAQNTLWPEVHKLYGHGFEVFAVASDHSGRVVASACKASKIEHAKIILWSTLDWQQKSQLEGHSLTVTEIAFSPDDKFLLTVSRDRTWCLYARGDGDFNWTKVGYSDKKTCVHARIIWSCAWSHDSNYFATVSRDKKLAMWHIGAESNSNESPMGIVSVPCKPLETPDSTTAVTIAPKLVSDNSYLIAFGLENGKIHLYAWNKQSQAFAVINMGEIFIFRHALTVKRLRFCPIDAIMSDENSTNGVEKNSFQLASCSEDNSVKIFRVQILKFYENF